MLKICYLVVTVVIINIYSLKKKKKTLVHINVQETLYKNRGSCRYKN